MDDNSQVSQQHSKTRFLANINSEDSLRKSTNLLEEILGKKLDRLKTQGALRESKDQAGNSHTKAPDSRAIEEPAKQAKPVSPMEKQEDCVSIQVRPKTSPRQSDQSESQFGSLMSGSLQKKLRSTEKDQVNITTQDGIRSEKNSEVFDIRVFKVPHGVMQPLDSISQQSEERAPAEKCRDDNSPDINPFDKGAGGESSEKDPLKQDLRRSVTEAHFQEGKPFPEPVIEKENHDNSIAKDYTAKARRAPTDSNIETARKNNLGSREMGESWRTKGNFGGYKISPMKTDNDHRFHKPVSSRNKVAPNSTGRAMLEFSDPLTGPISTENIILPENERATPGKSKVLNTKEKVAALKQAQQSVELKKGCLKRDGRAPPGPGSDLDDAQSNRNLALSSPVGSKKGILMNKSKIAPNEALSVYDMAGLPLKRSNTQMSRKSPTKVRFSEKPVIFVVESYKKYYKESYSEKEHCCRCSLI
jgi:hypothetical protein